MSFWTILNAVATFGAIAFLIFTTLPYSLIPVAALGIWYAVASGR